MSVPALRVAAVLICWSLVSCNEGLSPQPEPESASAVKGIVRYKNWPPPDSLKDLRIILFKVFPPSDILVSILNGTAIVYPPLGDTALVPFYVDSLRYAFGLPEGTYAYVAVVQQFGDNLFTDWRPVGQYDTDQDPTVPTPVTIPANDTLRNVNINVDFVHRPPPPF